jgi:3-hydroxybutyryl-CoA dehydrogenase
LSKSDFKKIGVGGAGQMGSGIAQVCATHGFLANLYDLDAEQLSIAKKGIEASLQKLESKDKIPQGATAQALSRIHFTSNLIDFKSCDIVIEAIIENEKIKIDFFQKLDEILPEPSIIASNTSSIPISRLAASTHRPDKFIGMHFMNPVPLMKLVEIITPMGGSEKTYNRVHELALALGKETIKSQDYPGFVVNRVLMPMINEAFNALMNGVASAEDIDRGMKLGTHQPMGPLALADFIGLDTCLAILNVLHEGFGQPHYSPSPLLKKYVESGYYGKKSGRGVYNY